MKHLWTLLPKRCQKNFDRPKDIQNIKQQIPAHCVLNRQSFIFSPNTFWLPQHFCQVSSKCCWGFVQNLVLYLIVWATDTIPPLKESEYLELLGTFSVFKNLLCFSNHHSFSFKDFQLVFSFYNGCVLRELECMTSSLECRAAGRTGEKILFSLIWIPHLLLHIDNICVEI